MNKLRGSVLPFKEFISISMGYLTLTAIFLLHAITRALRPMLDKIKLLLTHLLRRILPTWLYRVRYCHLCNRVCIAQAYKIFDEEDNDEFYLAAICNDCRYQRK